jgi:ribonuclease Z
MRVLPRLIALSCLLVLTVAGVLAQSNLKVTLLGTSSPIPLPSRFGPSTLVEAGDQKLLFDMGRGVPIRLSQLKTPLGRIDAHFITHFHSDHVSGIPDVWLSGWLPSPYARRTTPFRIVGPTGTKDLMDNLQKAYALDIKIRLEDQDLPSSGIAVAVEEFDKDGVVYEKNGVKVTAFEVNHGDAVKPAFGYRIDYDGRSAVISGDARFNSENLITYGAGADVLIHEVASARPELLAASVAVQLILAHHTTPKECGQVFARAKPKLAVYTHFVLLRSDKIPEPSLEDVLAETRQTYDGPLEAGEDLMSFEIGDKVTVRRFQP